MVEDILLKVLVLIKHKTAAVNFPGEKKELLAKKDND